LQDKIATGISIPKNLKDKIDLDRGDISRSKYILRILERCTEEMRATKIMH
jgi:metal-responsive CopG/Arc/MetJ family transcriptional regulator